MGGGPAERCVASRGVRRATRARRERGKGDDISRASTMVAIAGAAHSGSARDMASIASAIGINSLCRRFGKGVNPKSRQKAAAISFFASTTMANTVSDRAAPSTRRAASPSRRSPTPSPRTRRSRASRSLSCPRKRASRDDGRQSFTALDPRVRGGVTVLERRRPLSRIGELGSYLERDSQSLSPDAAAAALG